MRTWIPYDEVMEEYMNRPGFAEGVEQARREIDEEIALYGTIANPKPTPNAARARARALFPYRKNRVRAKEKPAFALQRKRVVA